MPTRRRVGRRPQVLDRHRVGALHSPQCRAGSAARLAVHRGEHGDLGGSCARRRGARPPARTGRRSAWRGPALRLRTPPPARAVRSGRGRPARRHGPPRRPPVRASRSAGCAGRRSPSSARRRRRTRSTRRAGGRRPRRGGRATRSRRSWRCALAYATRATPRRAGARRASPRGARRGCRAPRRRRAAAVRGRAPGCAGHGHRRAGRGAARPRRAARVRARRHRRRRPAARWRA